MYYDSFQEYLRETEPHKRQKAYVWNTAIGLQAVDGLTPSKYLVDAAIQNIEGKITLEEVGRLLDAYYAENPKSESEDNRTEEADKVSQRIVKLLSEQAFSFSPNEYISIHKKLFTGIYSHAGKLRDYNITKKEWVLDGATVIYGSASELQATLEYDFAQEKKFRYKGLSMDEMIHHFAEFVSGLWQIHAFGEGNTRTTAVFFIKYLRMRGFNVDNDSFAENAWYFRNALVRANYSDLKNGIHETTEFLELFLGNLLLGEQNMLRNRTMHISGRFERMTDFYLGEEVNIQNDRMRVEEEKADIQTEKADIDVQKANIEGLKMDMDIERATTDVRFLYADVIVHVTSKTISRIQQMYDVFKNNTIFGRSDMMTITGLKPTRASELLKELAEAKVIEAVSGFGKGKYRFR